MRFWATPALVVTAAGIMTAILAWLMAGTLGLWAVIAVYVLMASIVAAQWPLPE